MELLSLLSNVPFETVIGSLEKAVNEVAFDSRKVKSACLFIAVRGTKVDGHQFIDQAISKGAEVIVCDEFPEKLNDKITYIKVLNSAATLGQIAHNYYQQPSEKLCLIGVTGTNGKTTTATLLYRLFTQLGYKVGLLSTVENKIGKRTISATHTTPDALAINFFIKKYGRGGLRICLYGGELARYSSRANQWSAIQRRNFYEHIP